MRDVSQLDPIVSPALVQGFGVQATKTDAGGVVTAAQLSAGATAPGVLVIAAASEAFDNVGGGANPLVGNEAAVVDLDDDNDDKPHFGYDAVAKVRMDTAAPVRHRVLANSAAFRASSQPETGFQHLLRAEPGTIDQALIFAAGNPGVALGKISGDMVLWRPDAQGVNRLYWPVVIDGLLWGVPLAFLGPKS